MWTILFTVLKDHILKELIEVILRFTEDKVLGTASEIDDAIVMPILAALRGAPTAESMDQLFEVLTGNLKQELGDVILDFIEDKSDDMGFMGRVAVQPFCTALREFLNIPDGDD